MKKAGCIHDCGGDRQAPVQSGRPPTKINAKSGGHTGRIITGIMEPILGIELGKVYHSKSNWNWVGNVGSGSESWEKACTLTHV